MATIQPKDSPISVVRAVERWKRGAVGLLMVLLVAGTPWLIATTGTLIVLEWAGIREQWQGVIAVLAAIIIAPWALGSRKMLHRVGSLSEISDA